MIGRNFFYAALDRISTVQEDLAHRLEGLERQDLIRTETVEPDLEYTFKHPLIQEVIYNGILKSDRRGIHEQVGQAIEDVLRDRLPEFYERLAHHFQQGRSLGKAVDYLIKSGEKALQRFSLDESNRYFQQAYDLLAEIEPKGAVEIDLLFQLLDRWGHVFFHSGQFGELARLLEQHEQQAAEIESPAGHPR